MVRDLLDKHGLVTPSQHLVPGNLYSLFNQFVQHKVSGPEIQKQWQETMAIGRIKPVIEEGIERARILGQKYLCLQIIWPEQMATRELMDAFCKALNTAGELCAKAGLVFNFHNHSEEFKPINGYVPYDLILKNTDPQTVKLEMDLYWVAHAGPPQISRGQSRPLQAMPLEGQHPLRRLRDRRQRHVEFSGAVGRGPQGRHRALLRGV
jgi:hypothetical protein